jgi:hypothetical protein
LGRTGLHTTTGHRLRLISITPEGIRYIEEGEPTISQGATINIAGSVYGSALGTSGGHVEIRNVFTFNALEELIEENGGDDREALHEMAQEIRKQLEGQETLSRAWLTQWLLRHSEMLNRHGWIVQPIATLLLTWGAGEPLS